MSKTIVEQVRERIAEMQEQKAATLTQIEEQKAATQQRIAAAEDAIQAATSKMDLNGYEDATAERRRAELELSMLEGRRAQILQREISETESDKVVDSLEAYAFDVTEKFRKDLASRLKDLHVFLSAYHEEIKQTNNVLRNWQQQIHPNYRNKYGYRIDPVTGEQTSRMDHPVELTIQDCVEAVGLRNYLQEADPSLK